MPEETPVTNMTLELDMIFLVGGLDRTGAAASLTQLQGLVGAPAQASRLLDCAVQ